MTNAGIEAFLIVCKQHSISKAAELFISQSSLSIRLRTLEKEVGCPLFFRHKGSREMVLTEEGKRFYQLSLQYQDIVRSMLAIGNRKSSLRLSALNSVSTYLLPPTPGHQAETGRRMSLADLFRVPGMPPGRKRRV